MNKLHGMEVPLQMVAAIKPCPHCGSDQIAVVEVDDPGWGREVQCPCGAFIWGRTDDEAIAAWNRRVEA